MNIHLFFSASLFFSFCQDVHAIRLDQLTARSGYDLENPDSILHQQVIYKNCPSWTTLDWHSESKYKSERERKEQQESEERWTFFYTHTRKFQLLLSEREREIKNPIRKPKKKSKKKGGLWEQQSSAAAAVVGVVFCLQPKLLLLIFSFLSVFLSLSPSTFSAKTVLNFVYFFNFLRPERDRESDTSLTLKCPWERLAVVVRNGKKRLKSWLMMSYFPRASLLRVGFLQSLSLKVPVRSSISNFKNLF